MARPEAAFAEPVRVPPKGRPCHTSGLEYRAVRATFAPVLDKHLAGRSFLVGDGVTLADFSVGACFSYAAVSGIPWGDYANVRAWCARLDEIPAWKNTAPRLA